MLMTAATDEKTTPLAVVWLFPGRRQRLVWAELRQLHERERFWDGCDDDAEDGPMGGDLPADGDSQSPI
jgi:hypothetical protein